MSEQIEVLKLMPGGNIIAFGSPIGNDPRFYKRMRKMGSAMGGQLGSEEEVTMTISSAVDVANRHIQFTREGGEAPPFIEFTDKVAKVNGEEVDAPTLFKAFVDWLDKSDEQDAKDKAPLDHGSLRGLADDDSPQYHLLKGRNGGQTGQGS